MYLSKANDNIRKPLQSGELCVEMTKFVVEDDLCLPGEGDLPPLQTKWNAHTSHQTKEVFLLYLNKVIFCDLYTMIKVNKTILFALSDPLCQPLVCICVMMSSVCPWTQNSCVPLPVTSQSEESYDSKKLFHTGVIHYNISLRGGSRKQN